MSKSSGFSKDLQELLFQLNKVIVGKGFKIAKKEVVQLIKKFIQYLISLDKRKENKLQ